MSFPKFVYMSKNTPFFPILHVFAPLNDVRAYSAWSWKTTLITWIFGQAWYPPWHSSAPPPLLNLVQLDWWRQGFCNFSKSLNYHVVYVPRVQPFLQLDWFLLGVVKLYSLYSPPGHPFAPVLLLSQEGRLLYHHYNTQVVLAILWNVFSPCASMLMIRLNTFILKCATCMIHKCLYFQETVSYLFS